MTSDWFGVIILILLGTGAITPPVAVNIYVIKGIAPKEEPHTIFKGNFLFLDMMFVVLLSW